jgi:hypothetical protein
MPRCFQLPKRLNAPATLNMTACVMKAEMFTDNLGQFVAMKDFIALKQSADVFYARRLRQGSFDLVLSIHGDSVPAATSNVQHLFTGKGQG